MTDTPITDKIEEDVASHYEKLSDETNQAALDEREEVQKRYAEAAAQAAATEKKHRDYQLASSGVVSPPVAKTSPDEAETPEVEEVPQEEPKTAHEVVEEIKASEDADEVRSLSEGDDRKTVQEAAAKRLADLEDTADEEVSEESDDSAEEDSE